MIAEAPRLSAATSGASVAQPAPADAPVARLPGWQAELQQAFRDPRALAAHLGIAPCPPFCNDRFAFRVPRPYAARMRPGDPADPLLRQVWPAPQEAHTAPGDSRDPVGDLAAVRGSGMLHKYRGRALLLLSGACAVHCRYCFRRHFPYGELQVSRSQWQGLVRELCTDESLHEVILSGGDPLSLPDERLAPMVAELAAIPHLRRLRIHTRQPVVLPSRVDAALCRWLADLALPVAVVLHINHANEIDEALHAACQRLRATGAVLLNQAVLLAGVNDSVAAQSALSEALFASGVTPYYLHLLDRVQGAAHFAVSEERATALVAALRDRLPGYLVPRLAREDAGASAKTLLA